MRYLPHTDEDIAAMLGVVGLKELDDLFAADPGGLPYRAGSCELPAAMTEWELDGHVDRLAGRMAVSPEYSPVSRRRELRPSHPRDGLLASRPVPSS